VTEVFGTYSRYYDLLYRSKDYRGEAEYVFGLIRKHAPRSRAVLELGCGTGHHTQYLAEFGLTVTGVDRSRDMLAEAQNRAAAADDGRLRFMEGDIRQIRLGEQFDAVVSLFHVMSYQTTNEDIRAAFATAKAHLRSGGLFIFDCWYGPAVLTDRPAVRIKRLEDETMVVTRIAEPNLRPNTNCVEVAYTVFVKDKVGSATEEVKESHEMRYLFWPEIEVFAGAEGFNVVGAYEWMTDAEPGLSTWSACFVLRG